MGDQDGMNAAVFVFSCLSCVLMNTTTNFHKLCCAYCRIGDINVILLFIHKKIVKFSVRYVEMTAKKYIYWIGLVKLDYSSGKPFLCIKNLSTDADSRTDTILERLHDLS